MAGVDLAYSADDAITKAAVAVLSFPDLQLCDRSIVFRPTTFPYVPGFLWFREVPIDRGETIGAVVRSRTKVKPIYVSIGHRIDLITAIDYVLRCINIVSQKPLALPII